MFYPPFLQKCRINSQENARYSKSIWKYGNRATEKDLRKFLVFLIIPPNFTVTSSPDKSQLLSRGSSWLVGNSWLIMVTPGYLWLLMVTHHNFRANCGVSVYSVKRIKFGQVLRIEAAREKTVLVSQPTEDTNPPESKQDVKRYHKLRWKSCVSKYNGHLSYLES